MSESDSIINPDDPFARELEFTSDRFFGYLGRFGDDIITIPVIRSLQPGQGNFSRLLQAIEDKGFTIHVATPSPLMEQILLRKGFVPIVVHDPKLGDVNVLEKKPNAI